ncbi:hypothetical protein KY318_01165 [Candidatus Woesearchaeota archaeon]|nr:hypothetical protein [Candidatus Woesearchaeota archaeon]
MLWSKRKEKEQKSEAIVPSLDERKEDKRTLEQILSKDKYSFLSSLHEQPVESIDVMALVDYREQLDNASDLIGKYSNLDEWQTPEGVLFREWIAELSRRFELYKTTYQDAVRTIHKRLSKEFKDAANNRSLGKIRSMIPIYRGLQGLPEFKPIERIENYAKFMGVYDTLLPLLRELETKAGVFPGSQEEASKLAQDAKHLFEELEGLDAIFNKPECDLSYELKKAQELVESFSTISQNYTALVEYRQGLIDGREGLKHRTRELTILKQESIVDALRLALDTLKDYSKPTPPVETEYFAEEERAYRQACEDFSRAYAEVLNAARDVASGILERAKHDYTEALTASSLEELESQLDTLINDEEELGVALEIFGLDGFSPYKMREVERLRQELGTLIERIAKLTQTKSQIQQDVGLLNDLGKRLGELSKEMAFYGMEPGRLSRLVSLEEELNGYKSKWEHLLRDKYLAPALREYTKHAREISQQLEEAKLKALSRIDSLASTSKESKDVQGLDYAIQLYKTFQALEGIEERLALAQSAKQSIIAETKKQTPAQVFFVGINPPNMPRVVNEEPVNATTYFEGLIPRNPAYFSLVSALNGDMDQRMADRLCTFRGLLERAPPPETPYDVEFMERLKHGIRLIAGLPLLRYELGDENRVKEVVAEALNAVDAYLALAPQQV